MEMPPPGVRQTMLFSATFPTDIPKLASDFLSNYIFLTVGKVGSNTDLNVQRVEFVLDMDKRNYLKRLLNAQRAIGTHGKTLVRYQLPIVVIVFNNSGVYGGDWRNPKEITGPYKDDPALTSFVPGAGYHLLIEAFGGRGYLVGTPDELKSALSKAFSARKTVVINITIDPYADAESGRMQHKN
ncbi:unnamed protein product [Ilex paraguariensis]|uniref:2-hydroxyacyl-CoA lyase n=1 Tax=Ilex paraguariensis TaxID=185542 RepID=A0ABC8SFX5_9AQUA